MNLQTKVARTPNVAIFCRNQRDYLKLAIDKGAETPGRLITFRSCIPWKSAEKALEFHGERKIYFVPKGGKELVEYEAILKKVLLKPDKTTKATKELLKDSLTDEGLFEIYGEIVRTLYVITHCRELDIPFAYTALTKLSNEKKINANYGYSYAIVYEYCSKCGKSPCICSRHT